MGRMHPIISKTLSETGKVNLISALFFRIFTGLKGDVIMRNFYDVYTGRYDLVLH